jgi:thiosulfate dehydrogenase
MRKTFLITTALVMSLNISTAFAYTTQQVDNGKQIFINQCARCHGSSGEGGVVFDENGIYTGMKVPPIMGEGMLPNMKTVGNAYAFVKAHMPLQTPNSLSDTDALDVIAFVLMTTEMKNDGQPLTAETAQKIILHKNK